MAHMLTGCSLSPNQPNQQQAATKTNMENASLFIFFVLTTLGLMTVIGFLGVCYAVGKQKHERSYMFKILKKSKGCVDYAYIGYTVLASEMDKLGEKHLKMFIEALIVFVDKEIAKGKNKDKCVIQSQNSGADIIEHSTATNVSGADIVREEKTIYSSGDQEVVRSRIKPRVVIKNQTQKDDIIENNSVTNVYESETESEEEIIYPAKEEDKKYK